MDLDILEQMLLDENAEPMKLTLSLLEDITNGFSLDHQIGSGGFAVVYKGTVGKLRVAVKKLTRTHELPESKFHKEVECLMKARHRNIVRFLGYCAETQGKVEDCQGRFVMADMRNWLLCFEYVPNGSLDKHITNASDGLEWKERFRIIKGICHGLHYLHKKRILHLDLKPGNILLDDNMEPKIADFGLSRCLGEEQTRATTKHLSGTPGYLAPEFFSGKVAFASDIYSLGVIIMEILTGAKGFPEDENVTESWMNRLDGDMQLEQVRVCTKIGIECLEWDPKKRPVARHIIDLLDRTSADETGTSCSVAELQVSSLKEQSDQESIGKLAGSLRQDYVKGLHEAQDVAEHIGTMSGEVQDSEEKVNSQETSNSSSNSGLLGKLNIRNIFRRKPRDASRNDNLDHFYANDELTNLSTYLRKSRDATKNFARNGGPALKYVRGLRYFKIDEIIKITRNRSELLFRDQSGADVYKGTLSDSTIVAIKGFKETSNRDGPGQHVKVINIHIQMIHKNLIKLIGCCLEADIPILVYEYAANGSLQDIIHGNENKNRPLDLRLDIAIGSAEGLRHMHSADIRHGNVVPANILLDDMLTPKISDFELSESIGVDLSEAKTIYGTLDYMDPVFLQTLQLTLKSDVYSFGVVLLELITRKKNVYRENPRLTVEYCKCYEMEKSGRVMFDKEIAAEEDISVLEEIGQLAIECLKLDLEERPDMTEVTEQLVMIRRGRRLRKARNAS